MDKNIYYTMVSLESFLGCMIGGAVGDALCLPVEGYNVDICTKYANEIIKQVTIPTFHRNNLKFGQYSDDTQLSRETYITVNQGKGRLDPGVFGVRIASLFQPGAYRIVGYGKQTAFSAEKLRVGTHYKESGGKSSYGNGSVMRSPAVGALFSKKNRHYISYSAKLLSSITHASELCMDCSSVIALATNYSLLTNHKEFDCQEFIDYITLNISDETKKYIYELLHMFSMKSSDVLNRIIEIGILHGESKWEGISACAFQTTLWCLYCFMKCPNSYVDCVLLTTTGGGDVDTTCAVSGALIGSRVGLSNIPIIWREQLHDLGEWKYEDLIKIGEKSYKYMLNDEIYIHE
jgi:ADP-ribosyl-[dinitrogen reductase] hydrolase